MTTDSQGTPQPHVVSDAHSALHHQDLNTDSDVQSPEHEQAPQPSEFVRGLLICRRILGCPPKASWIRQLENLQYVNRHLLSSLSPCIDMRASKLYHANQ